MLLKVNTQIFPQNKILNLYNCYSEVNVLTYTDKKTFALQFIVWLTSPSAAACSSEKNIILRLVKERSCWTPYQQYLHSLL